MNFSNLFPEKNPEKTDFFCKGPLAVRGSILALDRVPILEEPIPSPENRTMVPKCTGATGRVSYPSRSSPAVQLLWVSREADADGKPLASRAPREKHWLTPILLPFHLGNALYPTLGSFLFRRDPDPRFFMDRYGRKIFHFCERFPCFDSYDYLNENRFYNWFFLMDGDRLVRIFYADGSGILHITTDVALIEENCWREMTAAGFLVS